MPGMITFAIITISLLLVGQVWNGNSSHDTTSIFADRLSQEAKNSEGSFVLPNTTIDACLRMEVVNLNIGSEIELENFIYNLALKNHKKFGSINWNCVAHYFSSYSDNFSVTYVEAGGVDGADIFRFSVDRSDSPLLVIKSIGIDAPNGIFTVIIRIAESGSIAIVRSGREPKWLRFD